MAATTCVPTDSELCSIHVINVIATPARTAKANDRQPTYWHQKVLCEQRAVGESQRDEADREAQCGKDLAVSGVVDEKEGHDTDAYVDAPYGASGEQCRPRSVEAIFAFVN
jgi:hypothetical protein